MNKDICKSCGITKDELTDDDDDITVTYSDIGELFDQERTIWNVQCNRCDYIQEIHQDVWFGLQDENITKKEYIKLKNYLYEKNQKRIKRNYEKEIKKRKAYLKKLLRDANKNGKSI